MARNHALDWAEARLYFEEVGFKLLRPFDKCWREIRLALKQQNHVAIALLDDNHTGGLPTDYHVLKIIEFEGDLTYQDQVFLNRKEASGSYDHIKYSTTSIVLILNLSTIDAERDRIISLSAHLN